MTLPHEEVNSLKAVRRFLYDLLDPSKTPRVPREILQALPDGLQHSGTVS
jgi:hypothetical protein